MTKDQINTFILTSLIWLCVDYSCVFTFRLTAGLSRWCDIYCARFCYASLLLVL